MSVFSESEGRLIRAIAAHRVLLPGAYRGVGLTAEEERAMAAAIAPAYAEVDRLRDDNERLREVLGKIAMEPDSYPEGCPCGHKLSMCHRVNANTWCGGTAGPWLARAALEAKP